MALKLPPAPKGIETVVAGAMQRAIASGALAQTAEAKALGGAAMAPAAPHEVFVVGLVDLSEGRLTSAAKRSGWRVLVLNGQEPLAAVEFAATGGAEGGAGSATSFKSLNQGRFVKATVEGLRIAEARPEVTENDYEVRLVEAPAVYFVALWLHDQSSDASKDLFLPLAPAPAGLGPDRLYREAEVLVVLTPLAKQRLQQDDTPRD